MSIQIQLFEEQLYDLAVMRDLGAETIKTITDKLSTLEPPPTQPSHLNNALEEIIVDNPKVISIIVNQLLSLYTIMLQRGLSTEELQEGLRYGITSSENAWSSEEVSNWIALEPTCKKLLSLSIVRNIVKAFDLSYNYTNLFQNAKIITDIRPIFNEDLLEINGAVISYSLRLFYDNIEGSSSISIALDVEDIKRLISVCERAIKKAKTADEFMSISNNKLIFLSNEED